MTESALNAWKKKLDFLRQQKSLVTDSSEKFLLEDKIQECLTKIRELEAEKTNSVDFIATIEILVISSANNDIVKLETRTRELQGGLVNRGSQRDSYRITVRSGSLRDLRKYILEVTPRIVHFINLSSNGSGFENEYGETEAATIDALEQLFFLFQSQVKCVMLEGNYSSKEAQAIARNIDYVIMLEPALSHTVALEFCLTFYNTIGTEENYELAFEYACHAISIAGINKNDAIPTLCKKQDVSQSYTVIRDYKEALHTYEQRYFQAIHNQDSLTSEQHFSLQKLKLDLAIKEEDVSYIESRLQDIRTIDLAIQQNKLNAPHQLAEAIIRSIKSIDYHPINIQQSDASFWQITLPPMGLKLANQKALLLLTCSDGITVENELQKQLQEFNYAYLILVAKNNCCSQDLRQLQVIWFDYSVLEKLILTPDDKVIIWLTLTLFQQTNAVTLPGILPYKTRGSAGESFFGRDSELARIINGSQKGGILIGAHRSGKTSFLNKLQEKLSINEDKVVGPKTVFSFEGFFSETLTALGLADASCSTPQQWANIIKDYHKQNINQRLVFLLDEVDKLVLADQIADFQLSEQMRLLQSEGYCEFFLAGHNQLRQAIVTEYSPLKNFAEEMILLGLTKEAAQELIQRPMKSLGFDITDTHAKQIYLGTSGVAVLIQEFCVKLLNNLHDSGASQVTASDIEQVEKMPEFLDIVKEYYQYAEDWRSLSITLLTAINKNISRQDIRDKFQQYEIELTKKELDILLKFLTQFGILKEHPSGHFSILAKYLQDALEVSEAELWLDEELSSKGEN